MLLVSYIFFLLYLKPTNLFCYSRFFFSHICAHLECVCVSFILSSSSFFLQTCDKVFLFLYLRSRSLCKISQSQSSGAIQQVDGNVERNKNKIQSMIIVLRYSKSREEHKVHRVMMMMTTAYRLLLFIYTLYP
jgi:hypothetical protein